MAAGETGADAVGAGTIAVVGQQSSLVAAAAAGSEGLVEKKTAIEMRIRPKTVSLRSTCFSHWLLSWSKISSVSGGEPSKHRIRVE